MTAEQRHAELREEWIKARPEYTKKGEFCYDGPSSWEIWAEQKPKILFLLKEPHSGFHPALPLRDDSVEKNFYKNIFYWSSAVKNAFEGKSVPAIDEYEMPKNVGELLDTVAIVNVKKYDQNQPASSETEIKEYAGKDRDFLRQQIDIINPDIIFCGNTIDCFDVIYNEDSTLLCEKEKCKIWQWEKLKVVDFWHPSYFAKSYEELYETLCYLLSSVYK